MLQDRGQAIAEGDGLPKLIRERRGLVQEIVVDPVVDVDPDADDDGILDGAEVEYISSRLDASAEQTTSPLLANQGKSFVGDSLAIRGRRWLVAPYPEGVSYSMHCTAGISLHALREAGAGVAS